MRSGTESANSAAAFTLIELLVVVAIISILAAIAVPNFLEAQTRAKIARVLADMRTVATAIESYAVDHGTYPDRQDPNVPDPDMLEFYFMPLFPKQYEDMSVLTTPVAYITSLPLDVFDRSSARGRYLLDYIDPKHLKRFPKKRGSVESHEWLLLSVGPNGYVGVSNDDLSRLGMPGRYPYQPLSVKWTYSTTYDSTNGTTSPGNVFRSSGRDMMQLFR